MANGSLSVLREVGIGEVNLNLILIIYKIISEAYMNCAIEITNWAQCEVADKNI